MAENELQTAEASIMGFVNARITSIQNDYLSSSRKSQGARSLAALRHAMMMPIGSNAEAWPLEFEGLPISLTGKGPEPSQSEVAVHGTMTLYAFHQQGQSSPMHVRGNEHGFGNAIRQLVLQEKDRYANLEAGEMPRRLRAFITAESMEETLHYARQLVQLLRDATIPIDYAKFAAQLYDLQNPYKADGVRLAWGRGYAIAGQNKNNSASSN
ncbi:MAG: type I-E CRISPR-associated protein Cse2/CasB [Coriobacteriales bacterium]|jgi:CRISPR system Cascade subunit CasB